MTVSEENPEFIPGLQLAERFYRDSVKPLLESRFPGLRHSAALIGYGSDVLGFDTAMSRDHDWGPRVMLFLETADYETSRDAVHAVLSEELPVSCCGYPTNYSLPNPLDKGTRQLHPVSAGPVDHGVQFLTVAGFFQKYLGIAPDQPLEPADWLTLPAQKLRSIVAGGVFHDDLGLGVVRRRFDWYPHDVWLYLMAAGWQRIGQEEHLMGRAGVVGDEIGSALIGARLVRDCMRLAFLMERQYPPYAKWFGTAFQILASATRLAPTLHDALRAGSWQEREAHLCTAFEVLAEMHNNLRVTAPLPARVSPFFGRPFRVIKGETFAARLLETISAPALRAMPLRSPIGNIDLFSDNTDLLEDPAFRPALRRLFE